MISYITKEVKIRQRFDFHGTILISTCFITRLTFIRCSKSAIVSHYSYVYNWMHFHLLCAWDKVRYITHSLRSTTRHRLTPVAASLLLVIQLNVATVHHTTQRVFSNHFGPNHFPLDFLRNHLRRHILSQERAPQVKPAFFQNELSRPNSRN